MKQPTLANVVQQEAALMVAMQRRLIDAGLIATARAVNATAIKLGWEAEKKMRSKK